MRVLLTLAAKDLRLLWRDKLGLFWVLGLPLIFGLFFGSIFGGMGPSKSNPLPVAVVAESLDAGGEAFAAEIEASGAVELERMPRERAVEAVRLGEKVAYLDIVRAPVRPISFVDDPMPELRVGIDPSRQAEAAYLRGVLMEASFSGFQELFRDPAGAREQARAAIETVGGDPDIPAAQRLVLQTFFRSLDTFLAEVADESPAGAPAFGTADIEFEPVSRERTGPRNSFEISFPSAILWGMIGCASAFAITFVRERRQGTMMRLLTAPLSPAQNLAGKALACFLSCAVVIALLLTFAVVCLGVRVDSPALTALAIACTSACFVGLMMFVSVLGRTEESVAGAGWGLFLMMSMVGGGMVPLIAMPGWMLEISNFSPVKWGIVSLEGGIWRGFTLAEMAFPCAVLVGVGALGFALGRVLLSRRMT